MVLSLPPDQACQISLFRVCCAVLLNAGGYGFIIGDSKLNYGHEAIN
jgi:hypothetical protein